MDAVYLYYEPAATRIPFFKNQQIFSLLTGRSGGVPDSLRQEIIFSRKIDAQKLKGFLPGIPLVQVEENSPGQAVVSGFFERPWNEYPWGKCPLKINDSVGDWQCGENPASFSAFPVMPSVPEQFSEYWQTELEAAIHARKYSNKTRNIYVYFNRLLCNTLQKTPEEILPKDITRFLAGLEKEKKYSSSSLNLAISSVNFFYRNILNNISITAQKRPRHDVRLPQVLSRDEIGTILKKEANPKHRLLLMLVYSSGLRVSEVVALKRKHIDISRGVIHINLGKGRKDRVTILSEKAAQFYTDYCSSFDIQTWVFPGQPPTSHLSIRSAQKIFIKAVRRAGINKEITIHSLRHTFATHLLENGTNIRSIQNLLGHSSIRTTERYTHIAQTSYLNVQSPLDTIM